ncbi:hypothetical protein [Streptomyces sp. NPDC057325]|uniref:hypothetical protein n=1 Tax=unclassified Streptomyces TaxID=2593676 RepID=UPI003641B53C
MDRPCPHPSLLVGHRVYDSDQDDPDPGLQLGHRYAELVGGPLDGQLLDITGWGSEQIGGGVALITVSGSYGPGGRALYDPRPGDPGCLGWNGATFPDRSVAT